jgi:hypothetical protein
MDVAEDVAGTAVADAAGSAAGTVDAGTETMSRAEANKIIAERDRLKEKVRSLTPLADAGQKAIDAAKTDGERLAALIGERDTYKTKAEKAEAAMTARLAVEIAAIPEAMRGLVPAGLDPADQLAWIATATAAGAFGQRTASPGAQLHGGQGGATITQAEFVNAPESRRKALRQQVAEGKLAVV